MVTVYWGLEVVSSVEYSRGRCVYFALADCVPPHTYVRVHVNVCARLLGIIPTFHFVCVRSFRDYLSVTFGRPANRSEIISMSIPGSFQQIAFLDEIHLRPDFMLLF